jgi:hypothetical protein
VLGGACSINPNVMSRKRLIPPTEEENKRINAGIAADTDTFEPSDEEFAQAKPAKDVLPPDLYEALRKRPPV